MTLYFKDQVKAGIGFGTYGTVVRAEDKITGTAVAIKLLHRDEDLAPHALVEQRMYEKLLAGCNPRVRLFAQVLGGGMYDGFHCIVFELCSCTLFDVLQGYSGLVPLPARHIVEIAYQLISGVEYLHSLNIAHTDIKLDNIALRQHDTVKLRWLDPSTGFQEQRVLVKAQICILDLGTAIELQGRGVAHGLIGARGYRAPEVALGLPWTMNVDNFSIGCVVSELYLGRSLFDCEIESEREYLAAIDNLLGPFPEDFARAVERKYPGNFEFDGRVTVNYPAPGAQAEEEYADAMRRLERVQPLAALVHDHNLMDLIRQLLSLNPTNRSALDVVVKHKFFDTMTRLTWK
ncbi:kinase-like domain-containing protein [Cubamyces menziesii]|nr:kinase-like domain-containing protein [Cubamyces menziesii]